MALPLAGAPRDARAWELIDPEHYPALWTTGAEWLVNPDQSANPALRRGMALLSVQCQDGRAAVFINHNFEVPADARVTLTIDDQPEFAEIWKAGTTITVDAPDARRFAAQIIGHRRLRVSVTWPGAAPTVTHFDVAGLDRAMGPVRAKCDW